MSQMEKDRGSSIGKDKDVSEVDRRRQAIATLLIEAKGDGRSFAAYAKAAGISPAAMTKMKKGEYIPSPGAMKKLTSQEANPQGGVTYEDMMRAAGYESEEASDLRRLTVNVELDDKDDKDTLDNVRKGYTLYDMCQRFEKNAKSHIYTSLAEKGIAFRKSDYELEYRPGSGVDLVIDVMDQGISRWAFDFKLLRESRFVNTMALFATIGNALKLNIDKQTKLSFVFNDRRAVQVLRKYEHAMSFRGEVSVILYNMSEGELVEEFYLSNYFLDDHSREIYLI